MPADTRAAPAPDPAASRTVARIAVRSTVWVTLGSYATQFIGFGALLILTRMLTPEIFGVLSLATFWSSLLNLRGKLGLNYAAIQRTGIDGDLLGTYFALDLASAIGSLAIAAAAAIVLVQLGYAPEVAAALGVLMLVDAVSAVASPLSIALEKELQLSRMALVSLGASVAAYTCAILLALAGAGLASLLAVNVIATVISIAGVAWVCRQRLPHVFTMRWRFDRKLAADLIKRGLPAGLSQTAQASIVTQYDNFLIGTFVGYATLGFYDRAYRIAHWPNLLLTMIVSRVGFLTYAKVKDDPPRLTHAVRLSLWVLLTLGVPITLSLLFGAQDVVGILYGPKWADSAWFLRFLTLYSLVWPLISVGFWLSVALGHTRATVSLTATQAGALILTATPLTLAFGAPGTLAGVMATMALAVVLTCRYIFKQVPLTAREVFAAPAASAAIAAGVMLAVTSAGVWNAWAPLARLAVGSALGSGVYLGALFALRPREMLERIRYLRRTWSDRAPKPPNEVV